MTERIKELEIILENGCFGDCEGCKFSKECQELENLQKQEGEHGLKAGQKYQNDDTNIFVIRVCNDMVSFIEGYSPSAIHNMQNIPEGNLLEYMGEWGFSYAGNF